MSRKTKTRKSSRLSNTSSAVTAATPRSCRLRKSRASAFKNKAKKLTPGSRTIIRDQRKVAGGRQSDCVCSISTKTGQKRRQSAMSAELEKKLVSRDNDELVSLLTNFLRGAYRQQSSPVDETLKFQLPTSTIKSEIKKESAAAAAENRDFRLTPHMIALIEELTTLRNKRRMSNNRETIALLTEQIRNTKQIFRKELNLLIPQLNTDYFDDNNNNDSDASFRTTKPDHGGDSLLEELLKKKSSSSSTSDDNDDKKPPKTENPIKEEWNHEWQSHVAPEMAFS
ncbi:MAG: hypothetical protein ACKN9V_09905 [Pseudomonadota bacterium]